MLFRVCLADISDVDDARNTIARRDRHPSARSLLVEGAPPFLPATIGRQSDARRPVFVYLPSIFIVVFRDNRQTGDPGRIPERHRDDLQRYTERLYTSDARYFE